MSDVGILGHDAVRGDPGAMKGVGDRLDHTADDLSRISSALRSNGLHGAWEGAAAEAFEDLVDDLPKDLDKAHRSFAEAATAVKQYAAELRAAHDEAESLARQLEQAKRAESTAATSSANATYAATAAKQQTAGVTDPTLHAQRQAAADDAARAATAAARQHEAAAAAVSDIKSRAHENRKQLDHAAHRAGDALSRASHHGMRNTAWSAVKRHGGRKVWHATVAAVSLGWHVGVGLVEDAIKLPGAIAAFVKDRSWKNFAAILDSVAAILTIAAIVVVIAAVVVATIGTGGAFLAAVPGILAALTWMQVGVGGFKVLSDVVRMFKHDPEVGAVDLAVDAAALGLAVVGARGLGKAAEPATKLGQVEEQVVRAKGWKPNYGQSPTSAKHQARIAKRLAYLQTRRIHVTRDLLRDQSKDLAADRGLDLAKRLGNDYLPRPLSHDNELKLRPLGRDVMPNCKVRRTIPLPTITAPVAAEAR